MADVKPCPFCGGGAWVHEHTSISGRPTYYTTHCGNCGVSDLRHHKSVEDAIEAWNNRVPHTTVNQFGENCTHIDNCGTLNLNL